MIRRTERQTRASSPWPSPSASCTRDRCSIANLLVGDGARRARPSRRERGRHDSPAPRRLRGRRAPARSPPSRAPVDVVADPASPRGGCLVQSDVRLASTSASTAQFARAVAHAARRRRAPTTESAWPRRWCAEPELSLETYLARVCAQPSRRRVIGQVVRVVGLLIESVGPRASVGEVCEVRQPRAASRRCRSRSSASGTGACCRCRSARRRASGRATRRVARRHACTGARSATALLGPRDRRASAARSTASARSPRPPRRRCSAAALNPLAREPIDAPHRHRRARDRRAAHVRPRPAHRRSSAAAASARARCSA